VFLDSSLVSKFTNVSCICNVESERNGMIRITKLKLQQPSLLEISSENQSYETPFETFRDWSVFTPFQLRYTSNGYEDGFNSVCLRLESMYVYINNYFLL